MNLNVIGVKRADFANFTNWFKEVGGTNIKCLICGRDLNIGEEVYVTIDGFICSDCIIDRCMFEEDFEENEE